MKVLSLFDGISCARVALKRSNISVEQYFASEVDKYAIQISNKNYPDIVQLGDVKNLVGCTNIDLLIGGSPCQDLSIAKKNRKGLDGERSGLFWEYVRILKEVKPKYFILENVNSMPKEAKELITKTLGVEPIMINASLVSAQNRKRLFWTNIPNVTQPKDKQVFLKDILEPKVDESFYVKDKSNTIRTSGRGSGIDNKHNWDTIRIGQFNQGGQGDRIYSPEGKSVGLSALGGGRGAKTGLYLVDKSLSDMVSLSNGKESKLDDRTLESKEKLWQKVGDMFSVQTKKENRYTSQERKLARQQNRESNRDVSELSLSSSSSNKNMQTKGVQSKNEEIRILRKTQSEIQKNRQSLNQYEGQAIRKLTCIECERLQGLPDHYTESVSNSQRYKMLGNAFNVDVVSHILSFIPR